VQAVESVTVIKRLVRNGWIRLLVVDPEASSVFLYDEGEWRSDVHTDGMPQDHFQE
jgi:uncharacterized protein YbcC (UPF0753/DUF2309 family)